VNEYDFVRCNSKVYFFFTSINCITEILGNDAVFNIAFPFVCLLHVYQTLELFRNYYSLCYVFSTF
jgi:hypothetical protein